jgi:hypothetical protein
MPRARDHAQSLGDIGRIAAGQGVVQEIGLRLRVGQIARRFKGFGFRHRWSSTAGHFVFHLAPVVPKRHLTATHRVTER